MFLLRPIHWLVIALAAWAAPVVSHAGFLVPGQDGLSGFVTDSAASSGAAREEPRTPSRSQSTEPEDRPAFHVNHSPEGMTNGDQPPNPVNGAILGEIASVSDDGPMRAAGRTDWVRHPEWLRWGVFRPPRVCEELRVILTSSLS